MFALVLAAAAGDADFERLFGPLPAPEADVAPVAAADPVGATSAPVVSNEAGVAVGYTPTPYQPPEVPGWALALGVLGLGGSALFWMKRRADSVRAAPLTVLHRQAIGDRSSLVLVEVATGDGERRRLLIGTGGGAPTLVSDLGGGFDDVADTAPAKPTPVSAPVAPQTEADRAAARAANIAEEVLNERRNRGRWLSVAGEDE